MACFPRAPSAASKTAATSALATAAHPRVAVSSLAALNELTELVGRPAHRNPTPLEKLAIANEIFDRFERMRQEQRVLREGRMLSQLQRIVS
jgi:hypothetical protein